MRLARRSGREVGLIDMKKYRLGRKTSHRKALLRNLAGDLVMHGRVRTTLTKAKFLRPRIERMVTKAARAHNSDIRELKKFFYADDAVEKLVSDLGPRFKSRPGGYTRILKLGRRKGDNAETAVIEFVE